MKSERVEELTEVGLEIKRIETEIKRLESSYFPKLFVKKYTLSWRQQGLDEIYLTKKDTQDLISNRIVAIKELKSKMLKITGEMIANGE